MPATYEPIATQTLGSAASSITFSSIGTAYTDLKLVVVTQVTAGLYAYFRVNGDTGNNYSYTYIYGDATPVGSGRLTSFSRLQHYDQLVSTTPCLLTYDVFSYAGTTFKTVLFSQHNDQNGSGVVSPAVGLWSSTSAINSISLTASTSTFAAGTTATLYGIKNA